MVDVDSLLRAQDVEQGPSELVADADGAEAASRSLSLEMMEKTELINQLLRKLQADT